MGEKTGPQNNWLYSGFRWLPAKEALSAQKKRARILKELSGSLRYHFSGSKISTGRLSPGCTICGNGRWSCLFVNGLCTANCFYCPQDRSIKEERAPFCQEGLRFDSPDEYVIFLQKFGFRGVGFSGGESLLAFKTAARFIKKIREAFKHNIYLWLYTNGKLIDSSKLRRLRQLGLNEIRFNISADNYNLKPVALAARFIDTVTVEIPAIPEDYDKALKSIRQMQESGVKFLNLHQLSTTKYNYKNFLAREYTFLRQPHLPVLESEITALSLLKYAADARLRLPVHYCSCSYQCRFQEAGLRKRSAMLAAAGWEEITPAGFIRSISLRGAPAGLEKIAAALKHRRLPVLLNATAASAELFFSSAALKHIHPAAKDIIIRYLKPFLSETASVSDKDVTEIALGAKRKLFIKKELAAKYAGITPQRFRDFRRLINGGPAAKQKARLPAWIKWERLNEGLPAID